MNAKWIRCLVLCALVGSATTGCSIKKMAINSMGDSLAEGGAVYAKDDDPELIKAAAPFSLKLMESLLAEVPEHQGLLFATASGFTQYAYAFVQQDAEQLETSNLAASDELRLRARKLYLRARDYGLRGLEVSYKGFTEALRANPAQAVQQTKAEDVRLMFWTAASWAAAISISKDDPALIGDLPQVEHLIDRALVLDEGFEHGTLHSFLINYEMARRTKGGDPVPRAREHFARAMELNGGLDAGPLVTLAESVSVQKQDHKEFTELLHRALAIDVNQKPEWRMSNLVFQRRARWLLSRIDELFLIPEQE